MRECPDKPPFCFNCKKEGHEKEDCPDPVPEARPPMTCFNCQGTGHGARDCTEEKKERERPPMTCYNC